MLSSDYKKQYERENYALLKIRIPKSKKAVVDALVETQHKSINRIFIDAVEKTYNVDLTLVESKLMDSE